MGPPFGNPIPHENYVISDVSASIHKTLSLDYLLECDCLVPQ